MNRLIISVILFWAFAILGISQKYDRIVSKTKSGSIYFSSIQEALKGLGGSSRVNVYIENGVYNEKIDYSLDTPLSLVGESVDGVVVTNNDYSGKIVNEVKLGTSTSFTFKVASNDFYAENITFRNTAGNVGQAVAVLCKGERQIFNNCKFFGFQDTYYANKGSQYNTHCYVEGATDFVFGDASCVFDQCIINCVQGGRYISAPADTKLRSYTSTGDTIFHGLLYLNCTITANDNVPEASYYLMRPWKDWGSAIYINCKMGKHIKPEGWSEWTKIGDDADNHLHGRYAEYKSLGLDGKPVDVSKRVSWSSQLTDEYVTKYYKLDSFYYKKGIVWRPDLNLKSLRNK